MSKYAVVLGITRQYGQTVSGGNDAKLFVDLLARAGFKKPNIYRKIGTQVQKQDAINGINWMKSVAREEDTVILFFGGHGNYDMIMFSDMGMNSVMLVPLLSGFQSQKQLVIIDSCRSGSLVQPLSAPHRLVVSSTLADTVNTDEGRYSLFGHLFLNLGMKQKLADANGDSFVSIQEAQGFAKVRCGIMIDNYGQEFFLEG